MNLQSQAKESFLNKIAEVIQKWKNVPKNESIMGFFSGKINLKDSASFLIKSLDELINHVEKLIGDGNGGTKKEMVLKAISIIFDYVAKEAMPFFLKPFSNQIKYFIINIIISNIIDFIVGKYNILGWIGKETNEQKI